MKQAYHALAAMFAQVGGEIDPDTPLIVLTADRPAELREVGAGQTIDQLKLYGDAVKWFVEVAVDQADADRLRWIRSLACRAYMTATEGRPCAVGPAPPPE